MAVEEEECEVCVPGAPGWIVTFSDLMSLLLTFFVLLLSFADMEVKRFRQVAASLKEALGVQREFVAEQLPMGTSIVMKEFKPGKQDMIDFENIDHRYTTQPADTREMVKIEEQQKKKDDIQDTKEQAKEVRSLLKDEIESGEVEVATEGTNLIIRIREKSTFASGSATLQRKFVPILMKVAKTINSVEGNIEIVGHTDNIPISTGRFRSNWELSTSRAVSVAHAILKASKLEPDRLTILGKGETQPIVENSTRSNRARNRRVEVVIKKPTAGDMSRF